MKLNILTIMCGINIFEIIVNLIKECIVHHYVEISSFIHLMSLEGKIISDNFIIMYNNTQMSELTTILHNIL
jgi:hypothetical protein